MKLPIWQVDAFSGRRFGGNPAAVVPLDEWLPDATLLAIAAENNLSETAYIRRSAASDCDYDIRWFTPRVEVSLCGHATLASAWVVLHRLKPARTRVVFGSKSGPLPVEQHGQRLVLDFPVGTLEPAPPNDTLLKALGSAPRELYAGYQWLALYETEAEVRALRPDMDGIVESGIHGVIVTAKGNDCDFVSRFFAPSAGVPEDPVTGSAHTRLAPFWAERLGKTTFFARQVSTRGGELWCELLREKNRVQIAGEATPFLEGTIEI
jgi:PhzF family phenazine biosynthesis protein